MARSPEKDEAYEADEVERRRDKVLKHMLNTPPQPRKKPENAKPTKPVSGRAKGASPSA